MTTAVLSDWLETKILNHTLRNTAYTSPGTSVFVGLYQSDPTDANIGVEVVGTGYARQPVTVWDVPASRATQNTNQITWSTAGASWGTVTHIGILDAPTAGSLLFYGQLTTQKIIPSGVQFYIAAGDIDITLDGKFSTYLSHKWLSHILRNTTFTTPGTSIFVGLWNTDPTENDSGTEVSGNNYGRIAVTAWDAPGATDGHTQNTNQIDFAVPSGSWGAVGFVGIKDAITTGNLLFYGTVDTSYTPTSGDDVNIAAGALDVVVS